MLRLMYHIILLIWYGAGLGNTFLNDISRYFSGIASENIRKEQKMENRIGLYYPSIYFDSNWIRIAALYWDKIGRIVPSNYEVDDDNDILFLKKELGTTGPFIEDFAPSTTEMATVTELFTTFLNQYREQLTELYSLDGQAHPLRRVISQEEIFSNVGAQSQLDRTPFTKLDKNIFALAAPKMAKDLIDELVKANLAIRVRRIYKEVGYDDIIQMNAVFAYIYMLTLAEQMAQSRQLHLVTNGTFNHLAIGTSVERLAQVLLWPEFPNLYFVDTTPTKDEIEQQIITIACQTIVPQDINSLNLKKLVAIRRQHRDELTAFQCAIHSFVQKFETAQFPNDSKAIQAHLETFYDKEFKSPLNDLQKALQSLGVETIMGAMNIRVIGPPLLAGVSLSAFPLFGPIIAGAGALAFSVAPVILQKRKEAKQIIKTSPVAYLLYAKEGLQPKSIAESLRLYTRKWLLGV